jgi:hypothetical protein
MPSFRRGVNYWVDGIIWVPALDRQKGRTTMKGWQTAGYWIAAIVLVVSGTLALATDGPAVAFLAVGGALMLATLLVCIGIGMLHGEVLVAERPAASRSANGEPRIGGDQRGHCRPRSGGYPGRTEPQPEPIGLAGTREVVRDALPVRDQRRTRARCRPGSRP